MKRGEATQALAEAAGLVDVEMICIRWHQPFIWTSGEQFFFQEKHLRAPRRCAQCRELAKRERALAEGR
jgi:hypothetical protein